MTGSSPPPVPQLSVLCFLCPCSSQLPHYVISQITFWSSNWPYALHNLPFCHCNGPSTALCSGVEPSPFPFCFCDIFNYTSAVTLVVCLIMVFVMLYKSYHSTCCSKVCIKKHWVSGLFWVHLHVIAAHFMFHLQVTCTVCICQDYGNLEKKNF